MPLIFLDKDKMASHAATEFMEGKELPEGARGAAQEIIAGIKSDNEDLVMKGLESLISMLIEQKEMQRQTMVGGE